MLLALVALIIASVDGLRCTDLGRVWVSQNTGARYSATQDGAQVQWTDTTNGTVVARAQLAYWLLTASFEETAPGATVVGSLVSDCLQIYWPFDTWLGVDEQIKRVHVVSMIHLDVGFTDTFRNVCQMYSDVFFMRALNTSRFLRTRGGPEAYKLTHFPWMIMQALGKGDCPRKPPSSANVAALSKGLMDGDVLWQGNSLNVFPELMSADHFRFSLTLAQQLNKSFLQNWGLCAKSTDVTGLSRATVPLFYEAGVRALHIGYNGACRVPEVPTVFWWRDVASNTQLLTMVENSYGVGIRGVGDEALAFLYGVDNSLPPSADDVIAFWELLRIKYPRAELVASTLDDFARYMLTNKQLKLPVITSEIGDSWLYGSPSDANKLAAYREWMRQPQQTSSFAFNLHMLKGPPEHNWGLSVGGFAGSILGPDGNWSNALFNVNRKQPVYQRLEQEWRDQLDWTTSYNSTSVKALLTARLQQRPEVVQCTRWSYSFGGDGSLTFLQDATTTQVWANASHPIGALRYQTFDATSYTTFNTEYNPNCGPPCGDFAKRGVESANPQAAVWTPRMLRMHQKNECEVLVQLHWDPVLSSLYGAPRNVSVAYVFTEQGVNMTVIMDGKPATRLPEAIWVRINPIVADVTGWRMNVLDSWVDPLDVVVNGTRTLHAIWQGVKHDAARVMITSVDAALVSPGVPQLLSYGLQPNLSQGWSFVLQNNLWGTAFPQWSEEATAFQFALSLGK